MKLNHDISRRVIVLGLGNLIRSDDGVGIHAIHQLFKDQRIPASVELLDGGTLGLQLLPAIQDVTHLLVLDAINTGAAPGTIVRFDISDIEPLPGTPSVHQIGFADVMAALRLLDKYPEKMILLGIQPLETGWGDQMSAPVQVSLPALIEAAIDELYKWVPHLPWWRAKPMCLAIPGKIISTQADNGVRVGRVQFGGIVRTACLDFVPEAQTGDYVMVHVGFAISRVDAAEAERTYEALEQMGTLESELAALSQAEEP